MAHTMRIPQIDLKAILAQPNPHIDLKLQAYESSTKNFLKAVSNYKNRSIATISDRRTTQVAEKKRVEEKVKSVETEINECKIKEIELVGSECLRVVTFHLSHKQQQ